MANEARRLQELRDRCSQLDGERKNLEEHIQTILEEMEELGVNPETIEKEIAKAQKIVAKIQSEIDGKLDEAKSLLDGQ